LLVAGCDDDAALPLLDPSADAQDARSDSTRAHDALTDASTDRTTADVPTDDTLRFIVMGDVGTGEAAQREVAIVVRDLCAAEGCDLVILLGDNIYNSGVDGVDDAQWQTKFEMPYADIDLPFYAVLGNHDYGGTLVLIDTPGLGNEWNRGPIEVQYSEHSAKWTMPATHYTFSVGPVGFVMIDTNSLLWDNTDNGDQYEWYAGAVAELRATAGVRWIFAAGHHPYLSNGRHGNAGNYEGLDIGGTIIPNPIPILNGANVQRFFENTLCGTVDFYMAGHDHTRQWLNEPDALCGTEMIVSGAGAKTTGFVDRGNTTLYQDDTTPGFLYVIVEGDTMIGRFVDQHGVTNFEHMVTR